MRRSIKGRSETGDRKRTKTDSGRYLGSLCNAARYFIVFVPLVFVLLFYAPGKAAAVEAQFIRSWEAQFYLRSDGTVWARGRLGGGAEGSIVDYGDGFTRQVQGLSNVVSIVAGLDHVLALTRDGRVYTWGLNIGGQLGLGSFTSHGTPQQVPGLTNVQQIVAGGHSTFAILRDGTVMAWGMNSSGQLGLGGEDAFITTPTRLEGLSNVTGISCGQGHTIFRTGDGRAYTAGYNANGQLGNETTEDSSTPEPLNSSARGRTAHLTGVAKVGAGDYHSFAIMEDGTVMAWGNNQNGQLGIGEQNNNILTPTLVSGLTGVTDATGGLLHSLFLKGDGTVFSAGHNRSGQLGDGTTVQKNSPTQVVGVTGAASIFAIEKRSFATGEETYFAWGDNSDGQLVSDSTADVTTPVEVEFGPNLVAAGSDWQSRNSPSQEKWLKSVWGASNSDLFAVGENGVIVRNGGGAWTAMSSGTAEDLNDVRGRGADDVFAVGESGVIVHYDGADWTAMSSGTSENFNDVWAGSDSDVFAVGENGVIVRYNGAGWTAMSGGTSNHLTGVWGRSNDDVFVVGDNGLIMHYDGADWTAMDGATTKDLGDVWGGSDGVVYAVGEMGVILRHANGVWTAMSSGTLEDLGDVWGASGSVFAVGENGVILRYDGGPWSEMSSGTTNWLSGVWGRSVSDVFAVGENGAIVNYDPSIPFDPALNFTAPCLAVSDSWFGITFLNRGDGYWTPDVESITSPTGVSDCILLDDSLGFTIPVMLLSGVRFEISFNYILELLWQPNVDSIVIEE